MGLDWRSEGPDGCFSAPLPDGAAGCWCRLEVRIPGSTAWWAKLEVTDPARGQIVREAFLGPLRLGARATLLHVPSSATGLSLRVFYVEPGGAPAPIGSFRVLGRASATVALLRHGWRLIPGALAGDAAGRLGRLRVMLGQAPARAGEAPGYDVWCLLYDRWGEAERAALRATEMVSEIAVLVVGGNQAGRLASLASVARQWMAPARVGYVDEADHLDANAARWTLVLRAGDELAPHALACFALEASRHDDAELIYADSDELMPAGRQTPLFKPGADARLLRAGVLTRGAVLVRDHVLRASRTTPGSPDISAATCPPDRVARVPFVLTHVSPAGDFVAGPPDMPDRKAELPFVSIVIPTGLRSRHVLRCLRRLVGGTDYPGGFEVMLAVSRLDPSDRRQAALHARVARLPGVAVFDFGLKDFNYARVNNMAVRQARGTLILLLNDDVAPIRRDWLTCMVAARTDPDDLPAGIVGARLLYGNGRVQHAGVIMGLAHLCEHAFRLARGDDPGPYGLALLDREVSAVTGACLLVDRTLYLSLGGMDERYAVALNDVDFCLRGRQAGVRVVLAASVCLHHYEGLSLGRHYSGARAALESLEVRQLRERWAATIAHDPFYHPCASLEPGREFQPGFPPRLTPLSWINGDRPAQG